jgi:hypothetical protein
MTAGAKLIGKQPKALYQHLLKGIVAWLAKRYKMSEDKNLVR